MVDASTFESVCHNLCAVADYSPSFQQALVELSESAADDKEIGRLLRLAVSLTSKTRDKIIRVAKYDPFDVVAIFLKQERCLRRLTVELDGSTSPFVLGETISLSDQFLVAVAEVIAANPSLKSLCIRGKNRCGGWHLTEIGATAMAESVRKNCTLMSFVLDEFLIDFDEDAWQLLLNGIEESASLKSFKFNAWHDGWLSRAKLGWKEPLQALIAKNKVIESLDIKLLGFTSCMTTAQAQDMAQALQECVLQNTALTHLVIKDEFETLEFENHRNVGMREICRTLAQLAKMSPDHGFKSLKEVGFRRKVFSFFIPTECVPAQAFVNVGLVDGIPNQKVANEMNAFPLPLQSPSLDMSMSETQPPPPNSDTAMAAASTDKQEDNDAQNADISEAIMRSKADGPVPISSDGQVILKIARMSNSQETLDALFTSPELEVSRARVIDAGCEIMPSWGGGAKFLVPFTKEHLADLTLVGKRLEPYHIVALRSDVEAIKAAFSRVASRKRPLLDDASELFAFQGTQDRPFIIEEVWPSTNSSLSLGSL